LSTARDKVLRWFARGFYACGDEGLPAHLDCFGRRYGLVKVLKHDFVAGTGLYESADPEGGAPHRLVCKMNRRTRFCMIPLGLLGRFITRHEVHTLQRCQGMRGVPSLLARLGSYTYVYPYIEGRSLSDGPVLPAGFFDDLLHVVRQIHGRNLVHFDLNKPGNILLGDDGRAHVVDFQISAHIGDRFLLLKRLSAHLRRRLQAYDIYHIYKHKRRFQPRLLTEAEERLSRNHGLLLTLQRALVWPYKRMRRSCLRYLHLKGILTPGDSARACAETDPARWTGK
jgi:serine/threonine protein kinase